MGDRFRKAVTAANIFLQGLASTSMRRLPEIAEDRAKRLGKKPIKVDEAPTPESAKRTLTTPATREYRGAETSYAGQRQYMPTIPEAPEAAGEMRGNGDTPWGLWTAAGQ